MAKYSTNLRDEINAAYNANRLRHAGDFLTDLQVTQVGSVIRRLNERKRALEREGLKGTDAYTNLSNTFFSMPHYTSKNGEIYIRQGKKGEEAIKSMDIYQLRRLLAVNANESTNVGAVYNKALQTAIKMGKLPVGARVSKANKPMLREIATQLGDLHNFIVNHTDAYYDLFPHLKDAVHRSGKLTVDEEAEFYKIMNAYNDADSEISQRAKDWRANNMF